MSEVRNRRVRPAVTAVTAVALVSLTASGCVTVHGELELVPTTTKGQAARALDTFVTAYNKADRTYERSADEKYVTGPLGAIDAAKLKAGRALAPEGNPKHVPLKLTDVQYTVPRKAGWPRWFVANADTNKGTDTRWLLVFTRDAEQRPWAVSYLTVVAEDDVPAFEVGADGWGKAVDARGSGLAVRPAELPQRYTGYLKDGGDGFTDGPYTSVWRETRKKNESRPGLATQYIDEPLTSGDYAPVGLRTRDGGALVFFTTRRYEKQTASQGSDLPAINPSVKALMTGEPKQSATFGYVSNQAALVPAGSGGDVRVLGRVQGITTAEGS
ncbi:hypothetical protein GTW43_34595 [Streptomyces sp. SID5785]|uniref:hypothetical protein n=1 Tax=Streptomyces sp. SID5785 TaxID=2690309 RepID=UPI001360BB26|nr:hypothetical protein [Streptomyces sp. SID5785]MZD10171.1 hypothetical protein [Streptomyces sp. SID5785]